MTQQERWSHIEAEHQQLSSGSSPNAISGHRPALNSARFLWLVRHGSVTVTTNQQTRHCPPGSCILRRPGQLFQMQHARQHDAAAGKETTEAARLSVLRLRHPAWHAANEADRQALLFLQQLDDTTIQHGPVLPTTTATQQALAALFDELCAAWATPNDPSHSLVLKGTALRLLVTLQRDPHLRRQRDATPTVHRRQLDAADRIAPAMQLLQDRRTLLASSWSSAQLAEACGISKAQFYRCFTLVTGETPRRYVAQLRIVHATELLLQVDLSLADIAARCGFSTLARFHAAFKEVHDCGPGAWRRQAFAELASSS